ncbi:MAG: Xaa-Pro aminopeptidase [Chloroflexi bacterium]|nr:Xaa-Pro aminopeptidase [Chloroflexota bacterium]|tara:strand:- start:17715 stop:19040 length:1326 start_codon:yes stop_codon:yes gene_type:complete
MKTNSTMSKITNKIFKERRNRLLNMVSDGIFILPGMHSTKRNNDVDYEFRQNSSFWYFSGFEEPDAVMILDSKSKNQYTMFVNPYDPDMAIWVGARSGIKGIEKNFCADKGTSIEKLKEKLFEITEQHECIYYAFGDDPIIDPLITEILIERRMSSERRNKNPIQIKDPNPLINEMRLIKTKEEINLIQTAVDITEKGFLKAMEATQDGKNEFEIQAILEYEFRINGAKRNGYPSIVASGKNTCTLHYIENDSILKNSELLLIDAGAEFNYYTADITRTWPINGVFTKAQRAIYEIVLEAQKKSIEIIKPGIPISSVHQKALEIIIQGLIDLKILKDTKKNVIENKEYIKYFMHGTSHWLGLDVHDVGNYNQNNKSTLLKPGMTFTVEPGIYFGENIKNISTKYKNIGIRIEDNILVTNSGHKILSNNIPKEIVDIEKILK